MLFEPFFLRLPLTSPKRKEASHWNRSVDNSRARVRIHVQFDQSPQETRKRQDGYGDATPATIWGLK